ncbi:hypothetical protein ACHAXR_003934 [Thalassiosira sp. AJA248-18]
MHNTIRSDHHRNNDDGDGGGNSDINNYYSYSSRSWGKSSHYPEFPAKALLGITVHRTKSTANNRKDEQQTSTTVVLDPPYNPTDFQYEKFGRNRTLLYWDEVVEAIEQTQSIIQKDDSNADDDDNDDKSLLPLWTNFSAWGPCYPRVFPAAEEERKNNDGSPGRPLRNWTYIVQSNSDQISDEDSIVYPTYKKSYHSKGNQPTMAESLEGLCRPGFLIIGQGKCGTSSLYHYIMGHSRILPAKEKQIHYFRYHKSKPLQWYYSHFPTIESFLGRGALMTGEASPGYMPYPAVVEAVAKRLSPGWKPGTLDGDGVDAWKGHVRSLPKIIAIVRDPITRAISSYKYNYIEPAMKKLRSGAGISASGQIIPGKKTDEYYREHHLFTFEELAFAELAMLKKCLTLGGRGPTWSQDVFGRSSDMFFYDSIQRKSNSSTPLIHLDGACYTDTKIKAVPRAQWTKLAREHPDKILNLPNLQLTQSIIGRGVYALPLEWWYEVFSNAAANKEDHIHVVCTEDMANAPDGVMEDVVTKFLGLPEFDFTNVTSVGRYNVGGHRGYDTVTKSQNDDGNRGMAEDDMLAHHDLSPNLVAISDALMNELTHFYHPYNERLFQLIGKRCPWE